MTHRSHETSACEEQLGNLPSRLVLTLPLAPGRGTGPRGAVQRQSAGFDTHSEFIVQQYTPNAHQVQVYVIRFTARR